MVDWLSLAVPLAYLGVLLGSLATFSSLYRKRKASELTLPSTSPNRDLIADPIVAIRRKGNFVRTMVPPSPPTRHLLLPSPSRPPGPILIEREKAASGAGDGPEGRAAPARNRRYQTRYGAPEPKAGASYASAAGQCRGRSVAAIPAGGEGDGG
jgi:hypothetical protein